MNHERRKALLAIRNKLDEIKSEIESVKDDEQGYLDNMPDSFRDGEKGEAASAAIDQLDDAVNNLDSAVAAIEESEA